MRNLKRALSLALAAVMVLGMMVIGAGAVSVEDFTDKDEIKHQEAVNVLTLLNVINGKEDGSYFDPTGSLTRAEMAKMAVFILHGGKEPVLGTKAIPTYSDIKGHWAEAYIEYCSSVGIIAGDGAGKFNPEGTLTGSQAAKMLLVAMNYDAKVFKFTGSNWEINVNREASAAGLYEELEGLNPAAVITRDDAAQLVYNAIQSDTMELSWNQNWNTGEVVQTYELKGPTLLLDKFGAKTFVGSFVGNSKSMSISKGEVAVNGKLTTVAANTGTSTASFPADLDIAQIGEEFKVLFKDGTGGKANEPDKKDTIYGVYNTGSTTVYHTTKGGIQDVDTTADKVKFGDVKYNYVTGGSIVTDYGISTAVLNDASMTALKAQSPDAVKFICNEDGKIASAYVTTYAITKVTAVTAEKVTLNGVGTIVIEDNDIYDGIAKNDVVVYNKYYDADVDDAFFTVTEAEVLEGKITAYTGTTKVSIDGTSYKIANGTLPSNLTDDALTSLVGKVDSTAKAYLVNGMVGALQETSDAEILYALVLSSNDLATAGVNTGRVQLLLADNTKTIYDINSNSPQQADDLDEGDLVKYSIKSDKTLNVEAKIANFVTAKVWDTDTKLVAGVGVASSDCVLFVRTDDSPATYKAYSVRNLKTISDSKTVTYQTNSSGQVIAAYVALDTIPAGGSSTSTYGMVLSQDGVTKVKDDYYSQYTLWTGGDENVTVYIAGQTSTVLTKGKMYSFDKTSDDLYDFASLFTALDVSTNANVLDVAVKEYSEKDQILSYYMGVTGNASAGYTGEAAATRAVDKDVSIVYVDAKNVKAGDPVGVNEFNAGTGYANAKIVLDSTGVVIAILVETSGSCDINGNNQIAATAVVPTGTAATDRAAINTALANSSSVVVTGNVTLDGTALNLTAGKTLIVDGDLTLAAAQTIGGDLIVKNDLKGNFAITVSATGSLNVTHDVDSTAGLTTAGTVSIGNDLAKLTDVTDGSVTVTGTIATLADAENGTITANTITTVTDLTPGADQTVTINADITTLTDVTATSTGKVVINGDVATLSAISSGEITFNGNVTYVSTTALPAATINLGGDAVLTLGTSSNEDMDISGATIKGVAGAQITVVSNAVNVAAGQLFATNGNQVAAGDAGTGDYVFGTKTGSMASDGFIKTA